MSIDIKQNARDAYPLKEKVRTLMLTIWNGDAKLESYAPAMHYLDCHFPENKIELALAWLVKNNLRGKRFTDYLEHDCGGSFLELHRKLLQQVEKATQDARRIMAGRDFK